MAVGRLGNNDRMKFLAPLLSAWLAGSAFVALAPAPARAATDCGTLRAHVERAKAALVEADAYLVEDKRVQTLAQAEIANHELNVARRYGDPLPCYTSNKSAGMEYIAAEFHAAAYRADDMSAEDLIASDEGLQKILHTNAEGQKRTNPQAFAAMVRYATVVHHAADRVRKQQRADAARSAPIGAQHDRGEVVAQALKKCESAKASQPAYGIDLPAPGGTGMGLASFYTATLDVDEKGRPDNVQIVRAVTDTNVPVDSSALRFVLQNAYYGPATIYESGRCRAVRSSVTIESGTLK
jgi:hypothetical protein